MIDHDINECLIRHEMDGGIIGQNMFMRTVIEADGAEVEAFDAHFPPKEKLKLPGQIFD